MSKDVMLLNAMPSPIKSIICLDGTSNSEYIEGNPPTNVTRIRQCISPNGYDNTRQITFYRNGVGTGYRNPLNALHQANGDGIGQIVVEAYSFLCNNYHDESDEIFLIGFSRGAFAARCLADLISKYGLMPAHNTEQVHELYCKWSTQVEVPLEQVYRRCHIKACALWDTVGALGIPIPWSFVMRKLPFIHSVIPNRVEHTFQGLALHEHRFHFFPIVLLPQMNGIPQLEQCWFAGYHADIGGGLRSDALAHFALVWTIGKLEKWINFQLELLPRVASNITWRVGNPSGPRIESTFYRLPLTDSMSWGFLAGGSKYRIPQTEFWDENGIYNAQVATATQERIHATTRFLTRANLVKPFYSASTQPGLVGQIWQWALRPFPSLWTGWPWGGHIQQAAGNNSIQEETIHPWEIDVLRDWAGIDHFDFDNMYHPPGENVEDMILVQLRTWLDTL